MAHPKHTINGNCFIVLRHTYRNHREELHDYENEFGSIHTFENYLHWSPEKARAIGLNPDLDDRHYNPRISNIKLSIRLDGKETPLSDIDQLAAFLDSHPTVADRLQYKAKQ